MSLQLQNKFMIGYSILEPLFTNVLQTKFVNEIYHSVMLKPIPEGGTKPAAPVNKRYKYVGLDDSKGFSCYCRTTGSSDVIDVEKIGGCNTKKHRFQVPTRLVFFNMNELRSHDEIIAILLKAVMKTNFIRLQKFITIPEEILRSEAPTGRFTFKENTFFLAIDFFLLLDIQTDNCTTEIQCEGVPNPFCLPG